MATNQVDIRPLALIGAESRLAALHAEVAMLVRTFPELKRGTTRPASQPNTSDRRSANSANGATAPTRTRRKKTAAEKRAIGERMKKYWAGRRKEAKTAKGGTR